MIDICVGRCHGWQTNGKSMKKALGICIKTMNLVNVYHFLDTVGINYDNVIYSSIFHTTAAASLVTHSWNMDWRRGVNSCVSTGPNVLGALDPGSIILWNQESITSLEDRGLMSHCNTAKAEGVMRLFSSTDFEAERSPGLHQYPSISCKHDWFIHLSHCSLGNSTISH